MIRSLLFLSSAFYFSSALDPCDLDLPGYDAGPEAAESDSTSSGTQTIGTQCTAIVNEFCEQAVSRCALQGFTESDCVSSDMSQCCSPGDTCNQNSTASPSAVDQCKSDIDSEDCNYVANSTLPDSCQSLLHP